MKCLCIIYKSLKYVISKTFSLGKYAVYDNWESWNECSLSCNGGKRKRTRDCIKSNFPPKSDPQTKRLISTYGSLSQVPLTKDNEYYESLLGADNPNLQKTETANDVLNTPSRSTVSYGREKYYYFDKVGNRRNRKKDIIDSKHCRRGGLPTGMETCNEQKCPGMQYIYLIFCSIYVQK